MLILISKIIKKIKKQYKTPKSMCIGQSTYLAKREEYLL